jgi:hypothetical protein
VFRIDLLANPHVCVRDDRECCAYGGQTFLITTRGPPRAIREPARAARKKIIDFIKRCFDLFTMELNEGKACDAILRHLEVRTGAARSNVRWPERENHAAPVELVCELGQQLYAVEHTAIEPFDGLIRLNKQADHHFKPIEDAISPLVPEGEILELLLPVNAFHGKRARAVRKLQDTMIAWITQTMATLKKHRYMEHMPPSPPAIIPGIPFEVQLHRFESLVPGWHRLHINTLISGDREGMRSRRIQQACDDKFPKLAVWKWESAARTILLFENPDIQLTNAAYVAASFLAIAQSRQDRPDETYLLDTYATGDWYLWPLLDQEMVGLGTANLAAG